LGVVQTGAIWHTPSS